MVVGQEADKSPRTRRGRTRSYCWQDGLEGREWDTWLHLGWKEVDVKGQAMQRGVGNALHCSMLADCLPVAWVHATF